MNEHFTNGMDYNALCAELRELREQKERLYFRDEALNRPDEIIKVSPKRGTSPVIQTIDIDSVSIQDMNQFAVNSLKNKPQPTSSSSESGCISFIVLLFAIYTLIQLIKLV
jgi:hypothetical protein